MTLSIARHSAARQSSVPPKPEELSKSPAHYRVAVDAFGGDLHAFAAFDGVVQTEYERAGWDERGDQEPQEGSAGCEVRPGRAVEHAVVVLEMHLEAQAHDAQGAGDGAFAWGEDRASDEGLRVLPDAVGEQRGERAEKISPAGHRQHWSILAAEAR